MSNHKFEFTLNSPTNVEWRRRINVHMENTPGIPKTVFNMPAGTPMAKDYKGGNKTIAQSAGVDNIVETRYKPKRPDILMYPIAQSKVRPNSDKAQDKKTYEETSYWYR